MTTSEARRPFGLPEFAADQLAPYRERAASHPDGLVDLSIGMPVDRTPDVVCRALAEATDAPGYPTVAGLAGVRDAVLGWLDRRFDVVADAARVMPVIGTKEFVAWLPTVLELGAGDAVVFPELAYPTYAAGARLAGADLVPADTVEGLESHGVRLLWLNSPASPHGQVMSVERLAAVVAWARRHGVVVASDECYLEFGWDAQPVSVLDPAVNGGSLDGVIAVHSLSKRSNLAGYRAGFVVGDPAIVGRLVEVRKHAGMLVPGPVQHAMIAALDDDEHVDLQRERYRRRREVLAGAVRGAGFRIDHSEASLYLWATRSESCWHTAGWLAEHGILVAPGELYGAAGVGHVRFALTATDERIAAAAKRLS